MTTIVAYLDHVIVTVVSIDALHRLLRVVFGRLLQHLLLKDFFVVLAEEKKRRQIRCSAKIKHRNQIVS